MSKYLEFFKKMIVFHEPEIEDPGKDGDAAEEAPAGQTDGQAANTDGGEKKGEVKKPLNIDEWNKNRERTQLPEPHPGLTVSESIRENLDYIKKIFNMPLNSDVKTREFFITVGGKDYSAFVAFVEGMVNKTLLDENVLKTLMLLSQLKENSHSNDMIQFVKSRLLPQNGVREEKLFDEIVKGVSYGECVLFIDGADKALLIDLKGWEHRGVHRPNTEISIRGPQEGFTETLRINTALIRKFLISENLVVESHRIGKKGITPCAVIYIKGVASKPVLNEVRRRIKEIDVDYLQSAEIVEQLIEDNAFFPAPQVISTERPDRVCSLLVKGKVAIIVEGTPFVLVVPAIFSEFLQSQEDLYIRFPYANMVKVFRIISFYMALLLPGLYVAVTNYHHEMIPTDLLFAIEAAREQVPFPSVVEVLLMEISFELIREASVRVPGVVGPTLGIIGALILGQAAVQARIVSPILIIIVAVTGISSFAIPNFSLAFSFRMLRFVYIFLGAAAGFLGMTVGLFIQAIIFCSAKTFGVSYIPLFSKESAPVIHSGLLREPISAKD